MSFLEIEDEDIRTDVLNAACIAKIDGVYLCTQIFEHAKCLCPVVEEVLYFRWL